MNTIRRGLMALALVAVAVGVLSWAGCSCEESEPAAENVVVVQPKPPGQQAAGPAPARQTEAARTRRRREPGLLTAPLDYTHSVVISAPRYARRKINAAYAQNEIKQFFALNGRYPHSLKELEQWRGEPLGEPPSDYTYKYDAKTGELNIVRIETSP